MTLQFRDSPAPNGEPWLKPLEELPRGLVTPPPAVLEFVAREKARLQPYYTAEYEKLTLIDLTLAWYFEGVNVAYRLTDQGPEILAVGAEEIGRALKGLSQEELLTITIKQP